MPILNTYIGDHQHLDDKQSSNLVSDYFYCITDRTQEDVDRVRYLTDVILAGTNTELEWKEFQLDLRGALNYSDLDRIERNLGILADILHIPMVSMERDVIPRVPYFKNLLINVRRVRESFYRLSNTPLTPDMPLNTYQKINDIEKILRDAYAAKVRNDQRFLYCGTELYGNNEII